MKKSIAWRITFVFTALVSLALCLSAMLTYFAYAQIQHRMLNDIIQTESSRVISRLNLFGDAFTGPFDREMAPTMYIWGESARYQTETMPPELRDLPLGLHQLDKGTSTWYVTIADALDGRLYVLFDSVLIEQRRRDFSHALMAIVIGFSLLAMLISHSVARWLTTPLNTLAERLTRWVPSSSSAIALHTNEADRLMEVFNRVQDQVDASIADQREFSANLHHEVRTPLTVIRSDAELILNGSVKDPQNQRLRLERIVRSVREIDQSLESTYSLAHARFEEAARVTLHDSVEDIFESLRLEADKAGLSFVNRVQPGQQQTLSHHALMTVMRNIVRNAVLHAAPGTLVVESTADGLQFTDSGPGIAPSELNSVFERYFSNRRVDCRRNGSEETASVPSDINQSGLGLAIAKRVCTLQSWGLEVVSPVHGGRGTRFILSFNTRATAREAQDEA